MKKTFALTLVAASLAVTSAFGQGYFTFASGKSQAWDGFTTGTASVSTKVAVSFLWAAASTSTIMPISQSVANGTSATSTSYTAAQAWAAILNGSDAWTVAGNAGASDAEVRQLTTSSGTVTYNLGNSFGVTGTAASTTYSLMMVSYDQQYASLAAAALAGSAVGWSTVFQYSSVTQIGTGATMASLAPGFGTFVPAAVPEPGTIALAGLGGLGLLALRRRNK